MTMRALVLISVAVLVAVPALAWTQAETPTASTPPIATEATAGDSAADSRVRCRRVEVTGSLVKRGRVCRTVREWRAISENGNYNARKMIEESTSRQRSN